MSPLQTLEGISPLGQASLRCDVPSLEPWGRAHHCQQSPLWGLCLCPGGDQASAPIPALLCAGGGGSLGPLSPPLSVLVGGVAVWQPCPCPCP